MCTILCHCPILTDVTLRYPSVWRCFDPRAAHHKTPPHALDLSECNKLSDALLDLLPASAHAYVPRSLW
jgi:hypothetical protein